MEPCNCGTGRPCTTQGKLIMWLFCSDDSGRLIAEYVEDYRATWIAYSVRSQKRIWHLVCKLLLLKASLVRNPGTCQLADTVGGCPDHWLMVPASPWWRKAAQLGTLKWTERLHIPHEESTQRSCSMESKRRQNSSAEPVPKHSTPSVPAPFRIKLVVQLEHDY